MHAIDPAMVADISQAALSDAEVESLLAGLSRPSPGTGSAARSTADRAFELALSGFAGALQGQFDRASVPLLVESGHPVRTDSLALAGTVLRRTIRSSEPVELICTRELIASMVDYRFGGVGVVALPEPARPLSVTERRALDSLLDSVGQVWRSNGSLLAEAARHTLAGQQPTRRAMTFAFPVRAGAGTGTLALAFEVLEPRAQKGVVATEAEGITLIATLARIRLSSEEAQSITDGDMIAFNLPQPIEVTCMGVHFRCLHGASNGRHALRVLSVSPMAARREPVPTGEIEYALELGRRVLSRRELEAIAPGDMISFDQAVDRPLPFTREGRCCGYAEVVVLPDGHALRIAQWQP